MIRGLKLVVLVGMVLTLVFLILSMITGLGENIRHEVTQYSILIFGIAYVILDLFSKSKENGTVR
ncbi:hypothetical protein JOC54_000085 [Alkalihalobacillus xiaoxiensis]|uniref:Uncharacterized protein n=1 Tax=Shouchella xiaoxiensis TaxID=766895 RepID=A0ABS2SMW2_9BACI|nr:hypothetical protein [Shouchella xiaoxiensis]MBM7836854.1 hypothetical protein [Shouchella xiaoxiensis]